MIRAFLAVELGDDLRRRIAEVQQDLEHRLDRDAPRDVHMSWVRPASIHLTVKFLGDTDEQLLEPLRGAIHRAVEEHRAIQVPLTRLGVFPDPKQPRVLWIGPSDEWERGDDAKRLIALHRTVEDCCGTLGLSPERRPLSPHLTLGRIKKGERQVARLLARAGVLDRPILVGSLALTSIALMKSDLRPDGPVHTKSWAVDLKGM